MKVVLPRQNEAYAAEVEVKPELAASQTNPIIRRLNYVVVIGAITVAAIAALAYLVLALQFQSRPFLGVMLTHDAKVQPVGPFSNETWSGWDVGMKSGDRIIAAESGSNQVDLRQVDDPLKSLNDLLNGLEVGNRVLVKVEREGSGLSQVERSYPGENNTVISEVLLKLTAFPLADLIAHFGVGFFAGLVMLGVGIFVLLRRIEVLSAQFLTGICAALAVVEMGRLDLMTTHELVPLWILAGSMLGGLLVSFGMTFPSNLAVVERIPAVRYAPLMVGLILTPLIYQLYINDNEIALLIPIIVTMLGAFGMSVIMLSRRQYTSSPVFREQASYALLATFFGLFPLLLWTIYQLASGGEAPTWSTPVVQTLAVLFVLTVAYAVTQYHLLETDRLIPAVIVYHALGGSLIVAYFIVVSGLSWIGIKAFNADSPLLIAAIVLFMAVGFVPIRNRLREQIDNVWFKTRRQYRERLDEVIRSMTNALNLDDVDRSIRQPMQETLAPTDVLLFVRDSEAQEFVAHVNPESGRPITDITFPFKSGLGHYLQTEASLLYLEPGAQLPPMVYQERSKLAILNTPIFVSLKGRRQLNGFLAVGARRNGEAYSYEDLRFIQNIADQAALALERAQIVQDLERRFKIQDVLSQVSRALNFAIDFDTLMELLYAQTTRVIEADIFSIAIADHLSGHLYYAFFARGDERLEHVEGRRWTMGRDLLSEVVRTQKITLTPDYAVELRRLNPNAEVEPLYQQMKAWMAVPLTADTTKGALGVMSVGTNDPTIRYSDDQMRLFSDIANVAASAIDKTRLFEATQIRTRQLEALNQISSQLSFAIEDLDRLLNIITQSAMEILKAEAGSLLLLDDPTGDLVFHVALGPTAGALVGKRISKDASSLSAEALKRGEPIIVNDTAQDSRWHGEVVKQEDEDEMTFHSRAILTTPLISQGSPIGVLQILNKKDRSIFTEEDAQLLTTFAAQAAVAIQNAKLFESQDAQLLQRVEELDRMAAIDQQLNKTLELYKVAEITLNWAIQHAEAKVGALAVVKPDSNMMRLAAVRNYPMGSLFFEGVGNEFSIEEGIWGRVIRSATPVFSRSLKTDPDYIETYPDAVSQIVVPIISAGEAIGIILLESDNETDLNLLDLQFLSRLADHASPAIANAQLFDQLRHQQEARAEFVSFIAHELKAPMTSMKGYTDLLMRGVVGPINDQQGDFLKTIYNAVNRMDALVSDLRDIERYESGQMRLEMGSVAFAQVCRESLIPLQQQFEDRQQQVVLEVRDDLPFIWGDHKRLIQVMTNFLTNGNKYTPPGGKVTVRVDESVNLWDTEGARRVLHVQIIDTGIGISEEDQKRLFREKYFRTDNAKATDQPGTGLGMVLTRGLILQHGGQVWVESELNKGTTFHFTLPLADEVMREAT
ncbi:MAG: hypothetical protein BroJett018_30500 [Chloroflexota bacterium]|nr:GAF domain-containing protein [Chloroflexota bacterium]NOG65065.1 GAF domain-containing protein [Chloroflexota bacterium]GIK65256.1 MAG: hypothetical protein BroJett018_30500 [Chloroflexota bacterium]